MEKFGAFFADDVEFYHDQGGVTLGRQSLTESIRKNVCGKVRRELVPGTLEVYPGAWKITRVISYDHHTLAKSVVP